VRAATVILAALLLCALSAGNARAGALTIEVTSVTTSLVRHDLPPKGYGKGDTVVDRDRLLNAVAQFGKRKGVVVGTDSTTTTFTSAHTAVISGTVTLPGGTLVVKGELIGLTNGGLVAPVVGGTGRYAKATGTVTVGPGADHVLNTYRLVIPTPFSA